MSDAGEDEFAGLPEEEEEFVEDAAEEGGSGEGEGEAEEGGDGEAEASGSGDSSEEEEDGENEYEADGFVVDEEVADEGEEGEEEEVGKKKRKKRRREKNFALDEEDYMLLEDNQVRVRFGEPLAVCAEAQQLHKHLQRLQ